MISHVVIWSAKAAIGKIGLSTGNNVTEFDSEADAREFANHLLKVNDKYSVMVCKVVSYHIGSETLGRKHEENI